MPGATVPPPCRPAYGPGVNVHAKHACTTRCRTMMPARGKGVLAISLRKRGILSARTGHNSGEMCSRPKRWGARCCVATRGFFFLGGGGGGEGGRLSQSLARGKKGDRQPKRCAWGVWRVLYLGRACFSAACTRLSLVLDCGALYCVKASLCSGADVLYNACATGKPSSF